MSDDSQKVLFPKPGRVDRVADDGDRIEPRVEIDRDGIKIGDVHLPGTWIEKHGITVLPGYCELRTEPDGGSAYSVYEMSRVTVTFLVGDIVIDESAVKDVQLRQSLDRAIGIATALDPVDGVPGDTGTFLDGIVSAFPESAEHLPDEPYTGGSDLH